MDLHSRRAYWDSVAAEKHFQHELRNDWLRSYAPHSVEILDCGCGYGRLLKSLRDGGYRNVVGSDFSAAMLRQCAVRDVNRHFRLVQTDGRTLPFLDGSFDLALLFTVLTCVPDDEEQRQILAEVRRVLRPGSLIYICDLLLSADARNVGRYQRFAGEFGNYGTFRLPEGIVLRHHSEAGIRALVGGFTQLEFQRFAVTTMNGNPADGFQYLGRLA